MLCASLCGTLGDDGSISVVCLLTTCCHNLVSTAKWQMLSCIFSCTSQAQLAICDAYILLDVLDAGFTIGVLAGSCE